ncbi:hypothetical protein AB0B63_07410 [Micromonospora sp. NPDC049081]|uniref:hypothetical protein n=1 Tax=Micromonospora sp. NPDC049081 TaxID=3155150 RepID=UPI0033CF0CB9
MLTDQQLTETALRLIDAELHRLATYDRSGQIGELLCEHHCTTPDCGHDPVESAQEMRAVHAHVKEAARRLRADLARQAGEHGVTLPTAAN